MSGQIGVHAARHVVVENEAELEKIALTLSPELNAILRQLKQRNAILGYAPLQALQQPQQQQRQPRQQL